MPYGRRSYRSYRPRRRTYRRRTFKGARKFARKRFTKYSTKQRTIVKAPVLSRELYVKLPWVQQYKITIGSPNAHNDFFLGNSICPHPDVMQLNSTIVPSGAVPYAGSYEYQNFYDCYRILGTSIKIMTFSDSTYVSKCILVPVTCADEINWSARKSILDGLSDQELASLPYAQCQYMSSHNGSRAFVFNKTFRKTKNMLGVKDIKDADSTIGNLPVQVIASEDQPGTQVPDPTYSFAYYFRIRNTGSSTFAYEYQVKMKAYVQLFGRKDIFNAQLINQ